MKTVQYRNLKFRVFAAFFAALYILFHGRPPDFADAFTSPEFYFQLALSFSIALVLIYLVHCVTKWLDRYYDWRSQRAMRMRYQFDLCVLLPTFLDGLFFYFYFKHKGENIFDNGFFWTDLPVVAGLFGSLSAYYWIYFLMASGREIDDAIQQLKEKLNQAMQGRDDGKLEIKRRGILIQFRVRKDILCFYRKGKSVRFLSSKGNDYRIEQSINQIYELYRSHGFVQINPGVVINKRIIKGYKTSEKRHALTLFIRKEYENIFFGERNNLHLVTKEYINQLKKSLE